MPLPPEQLAAFAKGPKPGSHEDGGDHHADSEEHEGDDEEMEEGGDGKFGDLLPLLEEHHDEIEACCDELDHEALVDPDADISPEDEQILEEGYAALPEDLKSAMHVLSGITPEQASSLASHLADENMISDEERVAGWLVRVGRVVSSGDENSEESDAADEDSGEHETDDSEEDDGY